MASTPLAPNLLQHLRLRCEVAHNRSAFAVAGPSYRHPICGSKRNSRMRRYGTSARDKALLVLIIHEPGLSFLRTNVGFAPQAPPLKSRFGKIKTHSSL